VNRTDRPRATLETGVLQLGAYAWCGLSLCRDVRLHRDYQDWDYSMQLVGTHDDSVVVGLASHGIDDVD